MNYQLLTSTEILTTHMPVDDLPIIEHAYFIREGNCNQIDN